MSPKQAYKAIKRWKISLVYDKSGGVWYAGDCHDRIESSFDIQVEYHNSLHVARTPEGAVEDYCNARNLEWENL